LLAGKTTFDRKSKLFLHQVKSKQAGFFQVAGGEKSGINFQEQFAKKVEHDGGIKKSPL
jgi:hypothetical protein